MSINQGLFLKSNYGLVSFSRILAVAGTVYQENAVVYTTLECNMGFMSLHLFILSGKNRPRTGAVNIHIRAYCTCFLVLSLAYFFLAL